MSFNLSLTGLSASDRYPGSYVEIQFGAGPASGAGEVKKALILANKSAAGTAVVETVYGPDTSPALASEQDAIVLFGQGSPAHLMVKRFMSVNQSTPLYVILPESTGTAASATLTLSGTATNPGSVRFWRDSDSFVDVSFAQDDGYAAIADSLETAINSKTDWGYTAAADTHGLITLTAKVAGARSNQLRFQTQVLGTATGISLDNSASTALATGSGVDDYDNVLAAIVSQHYYYLIPESTDSTTLGAIKDQVLSQALPINGNRQRIVSGSVDSLATSITQANALNYEREEVIHLYQSDWTAGEMAAHWVANVMLQEDKLGSDAIALNQNLYGDTSKSAGLWQVPAPRSGNNPTRTQLNAALNAGLTPVKVKQNGETSVVKRVTTKTLTGSMQDLRTADAHRITICDSFASALQAKFALEFGNRTCSDDLDEDVVTPPGVVQPRDLKSSTSQLIRSYFNQGLLQNVAEILAGLQVSKNTDNPNRMGVIVPLQVVDLLDQILARIDQIR